MLKWFRFVVVVAVVVLAGFVLCEDAHAEHAIGASIGSTKGVGATYRNLSDSSPWGWSVTGVPVVYPDGGFVSLGASAYYIFHKGNAGFAYASAGAGGAYNWQMCDEENADWCEEDTWLGVGFGPSIGFEIRLVENFGWSVELPIAILFDDGEFEGVLPIPNSSLVYFW